MSTCGLVLLRPGHLQAAAAQRLPSPLLLLLPVPASSKQRRVRSITSSSISLIFCMTLMVAVCCGQVSKQLR
jgi:hypothetical protein